MKKSIKQVEQVVKQLFKQTITPFLPSYEVVFTMYHVIPGSPVKKQDSVYNFEKGEGQKAIEFFDKVVKTTSQNRMAPSEVKLKKRKRVVQARQFGPIKDIQQYKIVA